MQLAVLHRKIAEDTRAVHAVVSKIFPVQIPAQYDGQPVSIQRFITRLNRVTEPLDLFNEIKEDKEVSPGQIFNTALWIADHELPENDSRAAIRVLWHLHPTTRRVVLTQTEWNRRRYYFWQMVMHELIHRHQETKRTAVDPRVYRPTSTQRDIKKEQEYYGNCDEIETHSHAAAVELLSWWGHLGYREAVHEALTYSGRVVSPTFQTYMTSFGDTPNHPALKHFKRKVRAWYKVVLADWEIYEILALPNLVGKTLNTGT